MRKIHINASTNYQVLIGSGSLSGIGDILGATHACSAVALISDDNVFPLYGARVENSLASAGIRCHAHVIPNGEQNKNLNTYADILTFLAENEMDRHGIILALGGGVVGDIAGFAAATYLRGIRYVQLPTTLLSAIDSSVGGKTGIDLIQGKNLVGAFLQPELVLCDTDTLSTLPCHVFADGICEAIKYGVLSSKALLDDITALKLTPDNSETIIAQCVSIKAAIIQDDELDNGNRQLLNLGHTFGHAMESCSKYTVSHGKAVGAGMLLAASVARALGLCEEDCTQAISSALINNHISPVFNFSAKELYLSALHDKKRHGGYITLILPLRIGKCVRHTISVEDLYECIQAGLEGLK